MMVIGFNQIVLKKPFWLHEINSLVESTKNLMNRKNENSSVGLTKYFPECTAEISFLVKVKLPYVQFTEQFLLRFFIRTYGTLKEIIQRFHKLLYWKYF